jgi:hypothetical protein
VNNTCYWPPDADDGQDESKLAQGKTIPKSDWVPWEITTLKSFSKTTKLTFIIKKTSYGFLSINIGTSSLYPKTRKI